LKRPDGSNVLGIAVILGVFVYLIASKVMQKAEPIGTAELHSIPAATNQKSVAQPPVPNTSSGPPASQPNPDSLTPPSSGIEPVPATPNLQTPPASGTEPAPSAPSLQTPPESPPLQKHSTKKSLPDLGAIDVNSAGLDQLGELPGIGPTLAQRIIDYRTTYGKFTALSDIAKVKGIGPEKVKAISQYIKF